MRKSGIWIASFGVVLIVFHTCYGLQTIWPSNISWLMTAKHDWGTHYLGWLFFQHEAWHFPIGDTHNYFYPVGTNVGFTDSIPLLAIFFKLFAFIIPGDFQYFGLWLFICHLLAAYYTILLFRRFKINDVFTFIAVIIVAANPVLIYRGLHPALCAHWLLIASIYIYYADLSVTRPSRILRYQFILLMIAALVNPYICIMVLGFTIITAIKLCFYEKAVLKKHFLTYITGIFFAIFLCWYIVGIIRFGESENIGVEGGYGLYGLNLHSLYNSFGFSSFFRGIKQVSSHQYEGFMYLGLGIFFILFVLFVYSMGVLFKKIKRRDPLMHRASFFRSHLLLLYVLIILYTLFAVTHVVTLDDKVLFKMPAPKLITKVGDVFRASARFFWPAYYLMILFAIIALVKARMSHALKLAILGITVLLQLYDTRLLFTFRKLDHGTYKPSIDMKNWTALFGRFDNIVMYPPFETTNLEHMDYQDFCWLAGKMGKPITTGYVARVDNKAVQTCKDSLRNILEEGNLSTGSLYITTAANLGSFSFSMQLGTAILNYLDGYYYIFARSKNDSTVLALTRELNTLHKDKIDSVSRPFSRKIEFLKMNDPAILRPGTIQYNIEQLKEKEDWLFLEGWAFTDSTTDNSNDSVFLVLKGQKFYIAAVNSKDRPDITAHFKRTWLDNAGFSGSVFTSGVENGKYALGIAIRNKRGVYTYSLTDEIIRVRAPEYAVIEKSSRLPQEMDIAFNAEKVEADDIMIHVEGWAFIKNQDADESRISIVLKNETDIYTALADQVLRPDVAPYFKSPYRLENAGFTIKILKSYIRKGRYQLGILINDNRRGKEGVVFTGKEIDI